MLNREFVSDPSSRTRDENAVARDDLHIVFASADVHKMANFREGAGGRWDGVPFDFDQLKTGSYAYCDAALGDGVLKGGANLSSSRPGTLHCPWDLFHFTWLPRPHLTGC
ncbi:hypothetical protein AVEN_161595-1 [Araneus ventricosus]|uniref:Uncharacterized protein n=1 Tax=Araneus ventricosus TaxID=182803 RepID=A0A4Y2FT66_ARAVE|nr:hypothetical protein AVEN_161595-1 [Araneus ventricosus]